MGGRLFLVLMLCVMVASCSNGRYYANKKYDPDQIQAYYDHDLKRCDDYVKGRIPDVSGGYIAGDPISSAVYMMNRAAYSSAISANVEKCMAVLGWTEISKKQAEYLPTLNRIKPNWKSIDQNPNFGFWLDYSGPKKKFDEAAKDGDAEKVAQIMNQWESERNRFFLDLDEIKPNWQSIDSDPDFDKWLYRVNLKGEYVFDARVHDAEGCVEIMRSWEEEGRFSGE